MPAEKNPTVRVLVVDDSFFIRKILSEILNAPGNNIIVLDTAQDGLEAVKKAKDLKPDVITLDIEMPRLNGIAALEKIMMENPTPVVMLSSHTGKGTEATLRALEIGAVDCVLKPSAKPLVDLRSIQQELVEKIKMAALCRPRFGHLNLGGMLSTALETAPTTVSQPFEGLGISEQPAQFLITVASSTGGPRALNEFFSKIETNPLNAFLIVQHIPVGFTKALAKRLCEVSAMMITEAMDEEIILGGHAYVARAGSHLTVTGKPGNFKLALNDLPPRLGVKPSADILMNSVAKAAGIRCAGVILTGMGRDGTAGLKEIRLVGGKTFAQDAESCVIYGMPKSAVESGVVDRQLPLDQLARELNILFKG